MLFKLLLIVKLVHFAVSTICSETTSCEPGFEKHYPNCSGPCIQCSDGMFRNGNMDHCAYFTQCDGKYQRVKTNGNATHDNECVCYQEPYLKLIGKNCEATCDPGKQFIRAKEACEYCPNGTYKNFHGAEACLNCKVCNITESACNATHDEVCGVEKPESEPSQNLSPGGIVGILLLVLVLIILTFILIWCCRHRIRRCCSSSSSSRPSSEPDGTATNPIVEDSAGTDENMEQNRSTRRGNSRVIQTKPMFCCCCPGGSSRHQQQRVYSSSQEGTQLLPGDHCVSSQPQRDDLPSTNTTENLLHGEGYPTSPDPNLNSPASEVVPPSNNTAENSLHGGGDPPAPDSSLNSHPERDDPPTIIPTVNSLLGGGDLTPPGPNLNSPAREGVRPSTNTDPPAPDSRSNSLSEERHLPTRDISGNSPPNDHPVMAVPSVRAEVPTLPGPIGAGVASQSQSPVGEGVNLSLRPSNSGASPSDIYSCLGSGLQLRPPPQQVDSVPTRSSLPSVTVSSTTTSQPVVSIRPDSLPAVQEPLNAGASQQPDDWEYESNITDNYALILQHCRVDDFVLAILIQERIITLPQNEDIILSRGKGHRAAVQALVPLLRMHRKKGFETFIKALVDERSRQDDLALILHRELAEKYIRQRDQGTGDEGDGRAPQADERLDSVDLTQPRGSETERKKIVEGKNSRETPLKKIDGEQNPSETRLKEVDREQNPIETPLKEIDDRSNLDETDLKDSPVNPNLTKVKEVL